MGEARLEVRLAAVMAVAEAMVVMEVMAVDMIPVEPEISAVISGVPTRCVNVWEAISAHACNSKTNGFLRFDPCGDCRVYGTWKRDRDEYIVFVGSSGIFCRDCYS